jgi:hypothetical protein
MASEVTKAIYELLSEDRPVTPAGAAYLLRADFTPMLLLVEIEQSLDWLKRNGFATVKYGGQFGPEYLRAKKT